MKIEDLKRGLYVSCQALPEDPLYGCMGKMSSAAESGGAAGVRINTVKDIKEVKNIVSIPIIGLIKKRYQGSNAYITPTINEVEEVAEAGADIIAVDATNELKPDGKNTHEFITDIKKRFDVLVMADISSVEDGINAWNSGADILATTLSSSKPGKMPTTGDRIHKMPDFNLIQGLVKQVTIPVFGEGGFWGSEDTVQAFEIGAHSVVIGSAITRPQVTTNRISTAIQDFLDSTK